MISTIYVLQTLSESLRSLDGARKFWLALSSFALLAPLAVVLFAFGGSADAMMRGRTVVLGMEQIVIVLAAGLIARGVYALGAAVARARASSIDAAEETAGFALNA